MFYNASGKMLLDIIYHKSVRRILKKCASIVKMAALILCLMMLSGFLHASVEKNILENGNNGNPSKKLLLRHQREISDEKSTAINRLPKILSMNSQSIAIQEVTQQQQFVPLIPKKSEPVEKAVALGYVPLYLAVDYSVIQRNEFKEKERQTQIAWRHRIDAKQFLEVPPNPSFIFHNKLPKSGSSTMNNILKKLSQYNDFNFMKMETSDFQTSDDAYLIKELKSKIQEPFFLLKHHRFLNFKRNNQAQPTYVNVMRDPLEWFTSRYYFTRYGWERKPGCRKANCGMSEADRLMDIDECVKKRHHDCMSPWMYIQFFCGTAPACFNVTTLEQKEKATEIAKKNILDEYYVIGILEHFEDTLKLFEYLLPKYFGNAVPIWKSDFVQKKQRMTKTTYKKEMSKESKDFFRNGPLHYEIELYNFALELFKQKLSRFEIEKTV